MRPAMIDTSTHGICSRCGSSQRDAGAGAERHFTGYGPGRTCFPLCEACWRALANPEARLPFYRRLVLGLWRAPEDWPAVEAAVKAGR